MGVLTGVKSDRARVNLLKMHRLLEFEETFSLYIEGKATSAQVKIRAEKMLEIGLPKLK